MAVKDIREIHRRLLAGLEGAEQPPEQPNAPAEARGGNAPALQPSPNDSAHYAPARLASDESPEPEAGENVHSVPEAGFPLPQADDGEPETAAVSDPPAAEPNVDMSAPEPLVESTEPDATECLADDKAPEPSRRALSFEPETLSAFSDNDQPEAAAKRPDNPFEHPPCDGKFYGPTDRGAVPEKSDHTRDSDPRTPPALLLLPGNAEYPAPPASSDSLDAPAALADEEPEATTTPADSAAKTYSDGTPALEPRLESTAPDAPGGSAAFDGSDPHAGAHQPCCPGVDFLLPPDDESAPPAPVPTNYHGDETAGDEPDVDMLPGDATVDAPESLTADAVIDAVAQEPASGPRLSDPERPEALADAGDSGFAAVPPDSPDDKTAAITELVGPSFEDAEAEISDYARDSDPRNLLVAPLLTDETNFPAPPAGSDSLDAPAPEGEHPDAEADGEVAVLELPDEAVDAHAAVGESEPHSAEPGNPSPALQRRVTELSVPLVKDGMGRWQIKSVLRRRFMARVPSES